MFHIIIIVKKKKRSENKRKKEEIIQRITNFNMQGDHSAREKEGVNRSKEAENPLL
jgi:hypothetical protein